MSRAISVLGSVLLALVAMLGVSNAQAQTVTWTGGGDGTSWNQATNWSSNPSLPGAANDVVIGAGAQAINLNVSPTIRSLNIARAMTATGVSLTLTNGGLTASGPLTLTSCNISISGGNLTLSGGAVITLNNGNLVFTGATQSITGSGEIVSALNNSGSIQANNACALTIGSGITVRTDSGNAGSSSIAFYMSWNGATPASILNQGTLRSSGNTSRIINFNNNGGTGNSFTNAGSLEATSGGDLTVNSGVIFANNGTLVLNTGGRFTCNGILNSAGALGTINRVVASSTLNVGGTFTTGPTFTLSNATGPINFSCAWSNVAINAIDGLTLNFTGGSFANTTINSPSTFTSASATSTGLTIAAPSTLTSSSITFSAGNLTLSGGAAVTLNNGNLVFNGGTQSITGSGEIVSAFNNSGSIQANTGCALTIAPGITVRTDSGNTGSSSIAFYMSWNGVTPASILNQGTIRSSGNTSRIINFNNNGGTGNSFTNAGSLEATNSGDVTINPNVPFANNGTLVVNTGGRFTCNGILNAAGGLGTITRDIAASTLNIGGVFTTGPTFTLSNSTGPINFSCAWSNVAINAIDGLTLNFTGGSFANTTINSPSTFTSASATSTGLTIAAPSTFNGSTLSFSAGNLTLSGGAVITLNNGNLVFTGATQSIAGSGEIASALNNSGSIQANNGCALTIAPGITVRTDSGNTGSSSIAFYISWNGVTPASILNQGVIRASGNASRSISFNNNGGTGNSFTNAGSLEVTNGGDITVNSSIVLANNGTLVLNTGGRFTSNGILNAAGGLGTINRDVAASTINVGGIFNTAATFTLSNSTGPVNFSCAWSNVAINAIDGLSLSFTGGSFANTTINSPSTFTNANATSSGLTVSAPMTLNSANISSSSVGLTLVGGAVITLNNGNLIFNGGTQSISGSGEIVSAFNNSGSIQANGGCALTIAPGITCRTDSGNTGSSSIAFYISWNGVTPASILNQGTLRASGNASRSISFNNNGGTGNAFTNAGSLEATNNGDVIVNGGVVFANNGTLVLNTGGRFTSNGILNAAGGLGTVTRVVAASTINVGGVFNTAATFTLSNATGPINFSCAWSNVAINAIDGLTLNFTGGSFANTTINSPSTFTNANATSSGLTVSAPMTLNTANISSSSVGLNLVGGAVIALNNGNLIFNGGTQSISGSGEIVSALNNSGSIQANNGCALTIAPGITVRTDSTNTGSSSIAFYMAWNGVSGATILNQGIIRSSGNGSRNISFNNNGGTGNGFTNAGTLESNAGGTMNISGAISVTSSGEVIVGPGSVLTVASTATFTLTGSGRITHQVNGGGTSTTTFGRVVVNGTMNLAGVIRVQYVNGYNPQGCRGAVTLIEAGTATNPSPVINGGFTSGQVPPKPNGLRAAVGTSGGNVFFASTNRGDVASLGGALVPDGLLTADDVIAYLNAFFAGNLAVADVASLGGATTPDGLLTPDDIIVFLDAFFAGCPS